MRISFEAELTVLTALTAYCALVYTLIALYTGISLATPRRL